MNSILFLVALSAQSADPVIDASEFVRLIHGVHAEYHDVSMVFEGEIQLVGSGRNVPERAELESQYQGHYAFRSDGATLLDTYTHYTIHNKSTYSHDIMASLGEETKIANASPDVRRFNYAANKRLSAQYDRPGSLQEILFLSYFRELNSSERRGYRYKGWEDFAGHHCLCVEIDDFPGFNGLPGHHFQRFWIDMARGGHPLKIEAYWGVEKVSTIDNIQLAKFDSADGKKLWLPARGVVHSYFGKPGAVGTEPTIKGTHLVVTDSVRINSGLKDAVFRVDRKANLPETGEIRRLRDLFDAAPLPRSDAAGVKAHLDRALKEADTQAERLEASSPARASWSWTATGQVGLACVGLGLLGVVGYRKWRGR